ncbi:PREDICTED: decorin-like [Branchiostoma belcheri]|uniref:Decorin-like n=1 Tax=Branchiostoma belcheri TaxID=7741 RepID=A0A6P4YF15_BRABE|nr:PREDICTED: decorin-like [Branchiostoma belcheri]
MENLTTVIIFAFFATSLGKTTDYTGQNLAHVPIDSIAPDTHTLRLSNNKITHLPSFNTTPAIRYLFIDINKMNNILPQTFQGLCELVYLDVDRNEIVSLRQFAFSSLTTLSELILSHNYISHISERAFYGLVSLDFLELSGNRLSVFPMRAIKLVPTKHLSLVLLRLNNISKIPRDIKAVRPETSYDLRGNPLRCPDESNNTSNNTEKNSIPTLSPYDVPNWSKLRQLQMRHDLVSMPRLKPLLRTRPFLLHKQKSINTVTMIHSGILETLRRDRITTPLRHRPLYLCVTATVLELQDRTRYNPELDNLSVTWMKLSPMRKKGPTEWQQKIQCMTTQT